MTGPIKEGDPRYSLIQDMIEGDARTQDRAAAESAVIGKLILDAEEVARCMTEILLPEEMRAAGYRFVFETAPVKGD